MSFQSPPPDQFKPHRPTRSVWVRLDALYAHPADQPQTSVPDGWDLVGNAPGIALTDTWIRSARGMWLAQVNFEISSADGRRTQWFREQLLPASVLRLRDP